MTRRIADAQMEQEQRAYIEQQIKELMDKSVSKNWIGGVVGLGSAFLAAQMQAMLLQADVSVNKPDQQSTQGDEVGNVSDKEDCGR